MGKIAQLAPIVLVAACGRFGFSSQPSPSPDASALPAPDATAQITAPVAGLVSYWAFDSWSAMTTADAVGGNNADCSATSGCPSVTPGIAGNAALFDGSTSCVSVSGLTTWSVPQFTISAWVKGAAMTGPVVVHESDSGCPSPEFEVAASAGLVQYPGTTPHNEAWTTAPIANPNSWHQLAVSWDGTMQAVYVDGVCQCNEPQATQPQDNPQPFSIGCYPTGGPSFFTGAIDEVRVYDRVLDMQEMADLVGSVTGTSPTPQACAATCATSPPS